MGTPHQIEKLIVKCTNLGLVSARINHCQGTLTFLTKAMDDETVKDHLAVVSERLRDAARRVQPVKDEKRVAQRSEFFAQVPERAAEEYNSNLTRFDIIEDEKEKKEIMERLEGRLADLRRQLNLAKSPQEAFQGEGASLAKDTRLTPEEIEQERERKEAEKAARQESRDMWKKFDEDFRNMACMSNNIMLESPAGGAITAEEQTSAPRSLMRQDSKSRWENGWMFPRRWM